MSVSIWVVVPCHRQEQLPWVIQNFKRQKFLNKKLCIVENGKAIGSCERLNIKPDLIATSEPNVSHARNVGVSVIRELHDDSWVSMWDDDDWYGPDYLTEVESLLKSDLADIYGKHRHFVAFPDSGLYLFNEYNANSYAYVVHGPSLVFRPESAVEFNVQREAEEFRWCLDMKKKGAKIWASSIHHLLYLRYKSLHEHTWATQDNNIAKASKSNDTMFRLGEVDLGIVTGEIHWQEHVIEEKGKLDIPASITSALGKPTDYWLETPIWCGIGQNSKEHENKLTKIVASQEAPDRWCLPKSDVKVPFKTRF